MTTEAYPTDTVRPTTTPAAGKLGTNTEGASLGELMGEIAADLSALMRKELELAKAEIKVEATKAGKAAGMLGGAAYAGHMVVLFGTLAIVFGIGSQIGLGWAALIMTAVWGVVAAVLAVRGRDQLRRVNPTPERTVQTLKEDAQWARHPTS
ncbi:MAG: hypothetical protein QOC82_730 [Frankiaceae bacterium]|nr:hypothetical protein [Frankiaceae bacterium]